MSHTHGISIAPGEDCEACRGGPNACAECGHCFHATGICAHSKTGTLRLSTGDVTMHTSCACYGHTADAQCARHDLVTGRRCEARTMGADCGQHAEKPLSE